MQEWKREDEEDETCHKLPAQTKNSMIRGMERTGVVLGWTRHGFLKIEKRDKIR